MMTSYLKDCLFLVGFLTLAFCAYGDDGEVRPAWEWRAKSGAEHVFTGERGVPAPEVRSVYDPGKPFSLEIRLKPDGAQGRLAGLVSDYASSKAGGWYLSVEAKEPFLRPRLVVVEGEEGYRSEEASAELVPGKMQTLLFIKDEREYRLWLDDRLILSMPVVAEMHIDEKAVFTIGQRAKDRFKGEIESVRLWDVALPAPKGELTSVNYLINGSFEMGEKLEDVLLWHRMTGTDVTPSTGWEIVTGEAYEGKRALRTTTGAPLVLMDEVWAEVARKKPWTFSIWMKADREGVQCELEAGAYWRLVEQTASKKVVLSREWKQYELVVSNIPDLYRRQASVQGPLNFKIKPEANATVWVDAAQWQEGGATEEWTPNKPVLGEATKPGYPDAVAVPRPSGGESSWEGVIPLRVFSFAQKEGALLPVALGIPFKQRLWNGQGEVRLVNAAGEVLPVQTEVLARQGAAGAVRILGVQFVDQLEPGWHEYKLEIKRGTPAATAAKPSRWKLLPATKPGRLWDGIVDAAGATVMKAGSLRAMGMDDVLYDSELDTEAEWKVEQEGPLYSVMRSAGRLVDADGNALLGYVARVHSWRDVPGVKVEVSVINTRQGGSVPLRTLYWHCESGQTGPVTIEGTDVSPGADRFEKLTVYNPAQNRFGATFLTPAGTRQLAGKAPQVLEARSGDRAISLQAPEAWKLHPSAIAWERGQWRGYLWPERGVRALLLPRGLAMTREFWLREGGGAAAWEEPPAAIAASKWWQENDVLLPFTAADPARHPFMDAVLRADVMMAGVDAAAIEKQRAWGVFDHGDYHGDGGWGNLESYRDWAMLLTGLRTEDPAALALGLRSARHYRDIDIDQNDGLCYVHNFNHVSGGKDPSHAWPGGVALHYLLTGSKRSKEVALLHGESILATSEEHLATKGLRSLGRWLLNLADVYLISGDERYKTRYFSQIEACRRELAADRENPDRSIFSFIGHWEKRRLVPFHAWYGIAALQSMQDLTGDKRLAGFIDEEIAATLNPELYRRDIEELWPGLSAEEGMPIMVADYARHRGSFAYPVLTNGGKETYPRLALEALYAWAVEGRMVERIEATISSTPLRTMEMKEEEMIAAAAERMWKGAAEELLNGDFSLSDTHWTHWRPFPGKSLSVHTNWEKSRRDMVALDANVRREGPRSLRYDLKPGGFTARISVDTHRFRMLPGHNRLTGWMRWDAGATPPDFALNMRDLAGGYGKFQVAIREAGIAVIERPPGVELVKAELQPPDENGWRRFELVLDLKQRAVANLLIASRLQEGASKGHLWLDSIKLSVASQK